MTWELKCSCGGSELFPPSCNRLALASHALHTAGDRDGVDKEWFDAQATKARAQARSLRAQGHRLVPIKPIQLQLL